MGVAGCVWGGDGWVSVDRRLFHRCGASVDLELSCLETLLSLEAKGSSEGIMYDEIYIICIQMLIMYVVLIIIIVVAPMLATLLYVLMGVSEA